MKTMYAILDVPYNHDFTNDISDHHIFESERKESIAAKLARMGASDDEYCVEIYRVDQDGEFYDGSDYDTPSGFIKRLRESVSKLYFSCLRETYNYTDEDAFISDLALSSIWADDDVSVPEERIDWLRNIWTASHRSVKDICRAAGLTQRGLAGHFGIPVRTVENWCMGSRACPVYMRMMMQEILGLVSRIPGKKQGSTL